MWQLSACEGLGQLTDCVRAAGSIQLLHVLTNTFFVICLSDFNITVIPNRRIEKYSLLFDYLEEFA